MTDDNITKLDPRRKQAEREMLDRAIEGVEHIRDQLTARGTDKTDINQTCGVCYAYVVGKILGKL